MSLHIVMLAGEASGDHQGARLARAIRRLEPDCRLTGIGGSKMREAGVELMHDSSAWGSIGILEGLKLVLPLAKVKKGLEERLCNERPDLLIPIDFGFFNVRVAHKVHQAGVRVLYYFPPRSWSREAAPSQLFKDSVDAVATPFPWSAELLRQAGIPAAFVGHPLLEDLGAGRSREELMEEFDLQRAGPVVALLPGSRRQEVKALWPLLLDAALLIRQGAPAARFITAAASGVDISVLERSACKKGLREADLRILSGRMTDVLSVSDAAAVCSGTAALEATILGVPMVILYAGSWIVHAEWRLRTKKVKAPFIGMPNLMAQREVVQELIQQQVSGQSIAREIGRLLTPPVSRAMKEELTRLTPLLGTPGATERTARLSLKLAQAPLEAAWIEEASVPTFSQTAGGSAWR